ncbi:Uncharacterised protein [Bordetella pertussis]|nr:Uncharacterised protein [Bordetella pertussis]
MHYLRQMQWQAPRDWTVTQLLDHTLSMRWPSKAPAGCCAPCRRSITNPSPR